MKKYKNGQHCHNQRKHFTPSILYVDGMMGKEAQVVLSTLSQIVANKMEEPISHVKGWVKVRISIMAARSYSCMLCGSKATCGSRIGTGILVWDWACT